MDSGKDIREAVIKYSDTLYRVCIVILCNEQDVRMTNPLLTDTLSMLWTEVFCILGNQSNNSCRLDAARRAYGLLGSSGSNCYFVLA